MKSPRDDMKDTSVSTGVKREKSLKDLVIENQTGKQKSKKSLSEKDALNIDTTTEVKPEENNIARTEGTKIKEIKKEPVLKVSKPAKVEEKSRPSEKITKAKEEEKPNVILKEKPKEKLKEKPKEKPDRVHKEKGTTKKKVNKTSGLIVALCIISLLFATDVVSTAKIASFFKAMVSPDVVVITADDDSQNVPVIGVSESNAISNGRLSTTVEDEQARLNQIAENSRVYCIISSSPYFESADSKGSLYISNPAESAYYTQVVIKTKNTEKEMYISPVIAPDEKIENDYLIDRSFSSGQYQANAYFNYYTKTGDSGTPEDYTYIGTMCAEVSIVIDNK